MRPRTYLNGVASLALAVVLLSACAAPAAAPTSAPPTPTLIPPTSAPVPAAPERILFIGDSFTYWNEGIEKHLRGLAASCDPPIAIDTARVVQSGGDLRILWDQQKAPNAIRDGNWDMVVLQE
ncbi:MAG: hypothetical protein ACK2U9_12295, partial [Anaerolineae bacterium]